MLCPWTEHLKRLYLMLCIVLMFFGVLKTTARKNCFRFWVLRVSTCCLFSTQFHSDKALAVSISKRRLKVADQWDSTSCSIYFTAHVILRHTNVCVWAWRLYASHEVWQCIIHIIRSFMVYSTTCNVVLQDNAWNTYGILMETALGKSPLGRQGRRSGEIWGRILSK
jgi:hypothetical protein